MQGYPSFFLTMLILVLGVTASALAFTFTIFDPPGSVLTETFATNNQGQIVGFFSDSREVAHGFLRELKKSEKQGQIGQRKQLKEEVYNV